MTAKERLHDYQNKVALVGSTLDKIIANNMIVDDDKIGLNIKGVYQDAKDMRCGIDQLMIPSCVEVLEYHKDGNKEESPDSDRSDYYKNPKGVTRLSVVVRLMSNSTYHTNEVIIPKSVKVIQPRSLMSASTAMTVYCYRHHLKDLLFNSGMLGLLLVEHDISDEEIIKIFDEVAIKIVIRGKNENGSQL